MVRAMVETAFCSDERFTQDEFRRWLDERPSADINHYELIGGRIVMTPPAGWPHGRIGARLVMCIGSYVSTATLGIVLDSSAGFDLPSGDTVEPDVSFVSNERLAAGPPPEHGKLLRIVPTSRRSSSRSPPARPRAAIAPRRRTSTRRTVSPHTGSSTRTRAA